VKLSISEDAAVRGKGVVRSTPEFEVMLEVPAAQVEARRKRIAKEIQQLEKNIANSKRQLADEAFLSRAPAHVVESIRQKLGEYESQLAKNRADVEATG
jgi:valyl-tRNA synthetase